MYKNTAISGFETSKPVRYPSSNEFSYLVRVRNSHSKGTHSHVIFLVAIVDVGSGRRFYVASLYTTWEPRPLTYVHLKLRKGESPPHAYNT